MTRADARRERDEQWIEAYVDGELGAARRWWLERRLARSPELRALLAETRDLSQLVAGIEDEVARDGAAPPLDLWSEIGPGLSAIDREIEAEARTRPWWKDLAANVTRAPALTAVAAAALLLLTLFSGLLETAFEGVPVAPGLPSDQGALRFLDTSGRPVWVSEEVEGTTIIWLMDAPTDA